MADVARALLAVALGALMAVVGGMASELIKRISHPQLRAKMLAKIHTLGIVETIREALWDHSQHKTA